MWQNQATNSTGIHSLQLQSLCSLICDLYLYLKLLQISSTGAWRNSTRLLMKSTSGGPARRTSRGILHRSLISLRATMKRDHRRSWSRSPLIQPTYWDALVVRWTTSTASCARRWNTPFVERWASFGRTTPSSMSTEWRKDKLLGPRRRRLTNSTTPVQQQPLQL